MAAPERLPQLQTRRLLLRPFRLADASAVQTLAGDRQIADTTLNIPHPYADGLAEMWIGSHDAAWASRQLAVFAVTSGDDELVGAVSLTLDTLANNANLGYWIGRPYWNRGYCTEAATAAVGFGFETLGLHRIHARHLTRNPASGRVMQKLGMQREGVLREHARKWDRYEDMATWGLLRRDWQPPATSG